MNEVEGPETQASQPVTKSKGNGTKVIALIILLIVVIALSLMLLMYGGKLFGDFGESLVPTGPGSESGQADQPMQAHTDKISIGNPQATPTLSKEDIDTKVIEEGIIGEGEVGYVFCKQLEAGDKVTTNGDPDKYDISGPVWFVYVDEVPNAWFEHDVKYIFIDAETGETVRYSESWPPDINGDDMFDSAEGCGGATTIYTT